MVCPRFRSVAVMVGLCLSLTVVTGACRRSTASTGSATAPTPSVRAPEQPPRVSDELDHRLLGMSVDRAEQVMTAECVDVTRQANAVELTCDEIRMLFIADPNADRMRIVAPIIEVAKLEQDHFKILLDANFHTALDARYSTSDGAVYSTFIHPLRSLTDEELKSALHQVASLVRTFGSSFSSTDLVFPGSGG